MAAVHNNQEHAPATARVDDDTSHEDSQAGTTSTSAQEAAVAAELKEEGATADAEPPLPDEEAPPLPDEPPPNQDDDGWDAQWEPTAKAWYFINHRTGVSQWENPRVPAATADSHGPYDRFANFYHFVCPCPA
jgi:hypothetical protein